MAYYHVKNWLLQLFNQFYDNVPFQYPWTFSGGIKMECWPEMDWEQYFITIKTNNNQISLIKIDCK